MDLDGGRGDGPVGLSSKQFLHRQSLGWYVLSTLRSRADESKGFAPKIVQNHRSTGNVSVYLSAFLKEGSRYLRKKVNEQKQSENNCAHAETLA